MDHALSFWIGTPGCGEIRREVLPRPGAGDVIVQTLFSGVSRGTEALVFRGLVPQSEHQRMRAPFQEGDFPAPVKYGYISVGRVRQGPAQLLDHDVFCLYPHQTAYVVPASAVQPLPDGVPASRAVLAANLETALNGIWDAGLHAGDRVTVIGGGCVGLLVAWLASRTVGCEVQLVDSSPARAPIAAALGFDFALPANARADADVVLHASGSPEGLELALAIAAFEATIVELSWYGDRRIDVPLGAVFHSRRLTLKSSQVGSIAAAQRSRWDHSRRLQLALRLLREPALDALINSECRFDELPQVMPLLVAGSGDVILHRVRYD